MSATPKKNTKAAAVPITPALLKHLTMAVKKHLLENGVEPRVMNEEVIR